MMNLFNHLITEQTFCLTWAKTNWWTLVQSVSGNSVERPGFKENFDSLWDKLKTKARHFNPVDGDQIVNFINY